MDNYSTVIPNVSNKTRKIRYARQDVSAEYAKITKHSVRNCMRLTHGNQIEVVLDLKNKKSYYRGLVTCGSVWDCPVCAAKISARRGEEIQEAVRSWYDRGGRVAMVTYTLRHTIKDPLSVVCKTMTNAIRFVHSGAPYMRIKEKYNIVGSISATEILYNLKNGWHYHKHQLIFIDGKKLNNQDLQDWITKRYNGFLFQNGFSSLDGIGVVVSELESVENISGYVNKWGLEQELTANDKTGSGITPFELLDNPTYKDRWIEYSRAMYGKRRLTWSRGLRDMLGLGKEVEDQDLVSDQEDPENKTLLLITNDVWKYIVSRKLRSELLDHADLGIGNLYDWFYWGIMPRFRIYQQINDINIKPIEKENFDF